MTYKTLNPLASSRQGIVQILARTVAIGWQGAQQWYANYRNRLGVIAILELDDATLRDIGVNRDDVRWAAKRPLNESAGRALAQASGRRFNRTPDSV